VVVRAAKNIVETAVDAGSFKTLVAAVKAAGLVDTLSSPGPFTVFAPTDAAFDKLPAGTVADLLKPENKAKLASILTYHVVSGKVLAKDVVTLSKAKTVEGSDVTVSVSSAGVKLNGTSTVTTTDIETSNGVIHVIDEVLLPSAKKSSNKQTAFCAGLPGNIAPFGDFDPAGFVAKDAVSVLEVKRIRESELTHGRLAMVGVVGFLVHDAQINFLSGGTVTGLAINQWNELPTLEGEAIFLAIGLAEAYRAVYGWEVPSGSTLFQLKSTYEPGNLGFDPLGLRPSNAAEYKSLQEKELSNGRLAMIAATGFVVQQEIFRTPVWDQFTEWVGLS